MAHRITVQGNGEPDPGLDIFTVVTDTYEAGGHVLHGNVHLHRQP